MFRRRKRLTTLVCESCGLVVTPHMNIRDTYVPDGCDHWFIEKKKETVRNG
jgi:hypothetical protein